MLAKASADGYYAQSARPEYYAEQLDDASRGLTAEYADAPGFQKIRVTGLERQAGATPQHRGPQSYSARWTGRIRLDPAPDLA